MNRKAKSQAVSRLKQMRVVYSSTANTFNITQASGSISAKNANLLSQDDFLRALRAVSKAEKHGTETAET